MKYERFFYHCKKCGNVVGLIEGPGSNLVCCGKEMSQLPLNHPHRLANKHILSADKIKNQLTVRVGEPDHEMTEKHHIKWIIVAQKNTTQRVQLDDFSKPCTEFLIGDETVSVYAYCSRHGLWAADFFANKKSAAVSRQQEFLERKTRSMR